VLHPRNWQRLDDVGDVGDIGKASEA
jgi:hypothetical protein